MQNIMYKMITALSLALLCFIPQPGLSKIIFTPIVDATLALNSGKFDAEQSKSDVNSGSTENKSDEATSQNVYFYGAPNFRFSELPQLWITPSVEFQYNGANNLLNIEDESFVFDKALTTYYVLGGRYRFNPTWSIKLKGFGRASYNQDTNDETLADALYNYTDGGMWVEGSARYRIGPLPTRSRLGLKSYARRYPNYNNKDFINELASKGQDTSSIPLTYEKDINVTEGWLRNEFTWGKLPILSNVEIHLKDIHYTEQQVTYYQETFSNDLRHDTQLDAYVELPFYINAYHQFELDYAYRMKISNQNVYIQSGDNYFEHYYTYTQNRIKGLYNFKFPFKLTGFSPRGTISYAYQKRQYLARPSKQKTDPNAPDGTYLTSDLHWETTSDFGLTLKQQLFAKWFNLFFSIHAIAQKSNTTVEDNAPYNYMYNTFTLGTALSF